MRFRSRGKSGLFYIINTLLIWPLAVPTDRQLAFGRRPVLKSLQIESKVGRIQPPLLNIFHQLIIIVKTLVASTSTPETVNQNSWYVRMFHG